MKLENTAHNEEKTQLLDQSVKMDPELTCKITLVKKKNSYSYNCIPYVQEAREKVEHIS